MYVVNGFDLFLDGFGGRFVISKREEIPISIEMGR